MAVTVYRSTDASAPALNGNAGSLITVLDAILVNGYGSQPAAGWTKSFSGTNAADYRMGAGNQFYIDVNDNNPNGTALGREAALRGYETMTALATGTNPFPTTGQVAAPGSAVRKSATNDGTARTWIAAADDRTLIFFCVTGDSANRWDGFYFGDVFSTISADPGRVALIAKGANFNTSGNQQIDQESNSSNQSGHHMARRIDGTTSGANLAKYSAFGAGSSGCTSSEAGPSLDGNYWVCPYLIGNSDDHRLRGKLRGLWRITPGATEGDTFNGTGDLSGKSFQVLGAVGSSPTSMALETSNTWDTSS